MASIHPLILCGGMGSRLWPMSRIDQPKQFQPVNGKGSLTYFQTTVQRHRGPLFHDPIIVTNAAQSALVNQQLAEIQTSGLIIQEPVGRNTGPAVLAAALTILPQDPDAILLVLPSDHIIVGDLNPTMSRMAAAAQKGHIILFGVTPGYAEPGYGYVIDGGAMVADAGLRSVARFVEKPPVELAQRLIDMGTAYWASGISMFRADVIVAEFKRLHPQTFAAVSQAVQLASSASGGITLDAIAFLGALNEPTERAIFEQSPAIALAPINVKWDDLGAWASVYEVNAKTVDGNVMNGDVLTLKTTNSLIRSDGRLVVVIGMNDIIVVDTKDALLVTDRKSAQLVKLAVDELKSIGRAEVVSHRCRTEAWGVIEALAKEQDYRMDLLTLRPGSTMPINGHGQGASFLSVVTGQATYRDSPNSAGQTLSPGTVLNIDKDTKISLTNTSDHDLKAFLLSITGTGAKRPDNLNQAIPLFKAVADA